MKWQALVVSCSVLSALCVFMPHCVRGHGRLIEPPSRASMWRYGYQTPPNYSDNQLFCGGFAVQWDINKGKCGVCGDPWQGPREHEAGGKYANGVIVRRYEVGSVITAIVQITASHMGYFEFRVCPVNNPKIAATWECLNRHLLQLADGSGTRYYVTNPGPYNYEIRLQLPPGLKCTQCVLQWKYNAGNSWGVEASGKSCRGCGAQEQFYACADIAVGKETVSNSSVQGSIPLATDSPPTAITSSSWLNETRSDNNLDVSFGEWLTSNTNESTGLQFEKTPVEDQQGFGIKSAGIVSHKSNLAEEFANSKVFVHHDYGIARLEDQAALGDWNNMYNNLPTVSGQSASIRSGSDTAVNDVSSHSYSDDESSDFDDYEYIDILQSLIDLLQNRLLNAKQANSATQNNGWNYASKPLQFNKSHTNTTNDVNDAQGKQNELVTDQHLNNENTPSPISQQADVKNESLEMSYKIETTTTQQYLVTTTKATQKRKYNLIDMLKLSSLSSTVTP